MENKSHAMAAGIFVLVVAALLAGLAVWLTRLVRLGASGEAPSGATDALLVRLAGRAHLERWIEVWEKLNTLVERTDAVNLDQKQILVALIAALEKTARGT